MKIIELTPLEQTRIPIEAEVISPDKFAGKTIDEIKGLAIWKGNRQKKLGELFKVSGESAASPEEISIVIKGDVPTTKRIGLGMSAGEIIIKGKVGMHVGAEMKGGKIIVEGDADHWAGAEMRAGEIHIKGNARNYLGSAYRGSYEGMKRLEKGVQGTIIVDGNAGNEVGSRMASGKIVVKGNIGPFAGLNMSGGEIVVYGDAKERAGGEMTKGKIIIMGKVSEILPTFKFEEEVPEIELNGEKVKGPFLKFSGDLSEEGNGSLYIFKDKNSHISP
ncbi:MAG: formylmethanofuran dehydrogenase subunit C [Candidatus Jordarchaeum sp.]|uniref:formylmethanofuran dehydrogenase subunit C n=1 Tax=Candidatus Jordarchaeum sp. TaxID=2823881 RepID=UPI00404A2392